MSKKAQGIAARHNKSPSPDLAGGSHDTQHPTGSVAIGWSCQNQALPPAAAPGDVTEMSPWPSWPSIENIWMDHRIIIDNDWGKVMENCGINYHKPSPARGLELLELLELYTWNS